MRLPGLPGHELRAVDEVTPPPEERGFVFVRRMKVVAAFAGGDASEPFSYDVADRERLDAVVVVAHYRDDQGVVQVVLRSALRPPVALRSRSIWPVPEKDTLGELWEVPAGLVEPEERSSEGLRRCALRELFEETGIEVPPTRLLTLGPSTFPAPGMIGERHFFFHAEIDPGRRVRPPEDGSILERHASVIDVPLETALAGCRAGEVEDAKTELALRRLAELLAERP